MSTMATVRSEWTVDVDRSQNRVTSELRSLPFVNPITQGLAAVVLKSHRAARSAVRSGLWTVTSEWKIGAGNATGQRLCGWLNFLLLVVVLAISPQLAQSADAAQVYFAGFAYIGDDASIATSYPHTHAIEAEQSGGVSVLDATLRRYVEGVANPSISLVFDQLATLKAGTGSAIVLAFAVDRETVSVEQIGVNYKLLVELSAQALFVDFREMTVLAAYPFIVQRIDVTQSPPTSEDIQRAVRELYLGNGKANIFGEFSTTLGSVKLNPSVERRIRVTRASVADGPRAILSAGSGVSAEALGMTLAQDFTKYLSVNQGIPVLPPSQGQAIGNRMAARFADGRVYNLTIPEADYEIHLSLDELKRVEYGKSAAGSSYIYGAFLTVHVEEPLTGRVYFDARLKQGVTKLVPVSQVNIDDAPAFQDSLIALMNGFTIALTNPDPAWAETHAGNRAVAKQMLDLRKVLQSCH